MSGAATIAMRNRGVGRALRRKSQAIIRRGAKHADGRFRRRSGLQGPRLTFLP